MSYIYGIDELNPPSWFHFLMYIYDVEFTLTTSSFSKSSNIIDKTICYNIETACNVATKYYRLIPYSIPRMLDNTNKV